MPEPAPVTMATFSPAVISRLLLLVAISRRRARTTAKAVAWFWALHHCIPAVSVPLAQSSPGTDRMPARVIDGLRGNGIIAKDGPPGCDMADHPNHGARIFFDPGRAARDGRTMQCPVRSRL